MVEQTFSRLKSEAQKLPRKPGIYFFVNAKNKMVYIGKARSLQHRVKSYFLATTDPKVKNIVAETARIDHILTESEREASFLENNFIRQYQPKYNLRLKDDKSFPYLKLSIQEEYPSITLTRRVEKDGARYFGPFSPAHQARKTIHLLNKYFGIRGCTEAVPGKRKRPCLEYDLDLCSAPCTKYISAADYQDRVKNALLFLEGKVDMLLKKLKSNMRAAAQKQAYEEAAVWRDLILTLEQIKNKPRFISISADDIDIFGYFRKKNRAAIYVFLMRKGKVIESDSADFEIPERQQDGAVLANQIFQFYELRGDFPDKILLPFPLPAPEETTKKLEELKKGKIILSAPTRGKHKRLIAIANRNAAELFSQENKIENTLIGLQHALKLASFPMLIEGYDISNTGGTESVGAQVVFKNGAPFKDKYRKYIIQTVTGPNDVVSLQEVLQRRFTNQEQKQYTKPDLILVDGGKGQFSAAQQILTKLGLGELPLISIAKKEEIIYSDHFSSGLKLSRTDPVLRMVQSIRDEAHRFAISFHRRRRTKKSFASELDNIPGIGPHRKAALQTLYHSLEDIQKAPLDELNKLVGTKAAAALRKKLGQWVS